MSDSKLPGIECEEFYNLMQNYRHAPIVDVHRVCETYEAVEAFIQSHIEAKERAAWDAAATDDEFEKITFETWKESQK